ncbi:nuclease-related domain-containing protein [Edaphobacillus lindanitolerans]|nr:nuclease-related domain-containing protein [Edaphobacillus lindanitolerans]
MNSFAMEWALREAAHRIWGNERKRNELGKQLSNHQAGMAGERRVLGLLHSILLPEECQILHDLNFRLPGGQQFQVDILAIFKSGAILLETKQIAGRLKFCTSPASLQKLSENGQVIASMECPAAQLHDQIGNMAELLYRNNIRLPISGRVVFANHPIIEQIPSNLPVIKARELRRYIRTKLQEPACLQKGEINTVASVIRSQQVHYLPFPFSERHGFTDRDFYLGPLCSKCRGRLTKQTERAWNCASCNAVHREPYAETLLAYFVLISNRITVKQCMKLLLLRSSTHARNIINRFAVRKVGQGKHTEYELDYEQQFKRLFNDKRTGLLLLND